MDLSEVKSVTVLGLGCSSCKKMLKNTEEACGQLGLPFKPEYVTDAEKIMAYGCMQMPALAVNGKLVFQGRVLSSKEVTDVIIEKH